MKSAGVDGAYLEKYAQKVGELSDPWMQAAAREVGDAALLHCDGGE